MSLTVHKTTRSRRGVRAPGLAFALLALGALPAVHCAPDALDEQKTENVDDVALDPQTLFDTQVKPIVTGSCSCHYTQQVSVTPFLAMGTEYAAITTFEMGKFMTPVADMSLLLLKGQHTGPALSTDESTKVRGWLTAEAATRGGGASSPTTPTVPLRVGDFFMSLEALTKDPEASITFKMTQVVGTTYRLSNIQVNAGPTGGIAIKHPRFIIFTANGATPETSDGLSTVDMTVGAGMAAAMGGGSLLLTDLPASSARMALAFQTISVVNPTMVSAGCANLAAFDPAVKTQLATCAAICHSPTASDPRRAQANGAFNMASAMSSDATLVGQLCVNAKGRIDKKSPDKSILVVQPQPAASGGTPNHPYKINDTTQFTAYKNAIVTWASGEK